MTKPLKRFRIVSDRDSEEEPLEVAEHIEEFIEALPEGLSDALQLMNHKMSSLQTENRELKQAIHSYESNLNKNTEQVSRLGNSVALLVGKFEEKIVTGINPDIAISPHADLSRADVALIDSPLPSEAVYPFTTGELAGLIGVTASRLGHFFRIASIQGDPRYHCAIKTGKTNYVQKYKVRAIKALHEAVVAGKVPDMKDRDRALLTRCLAMLNSR